MTHVTVSFTIKHVTLENLCYAKTFTHHLPDGNKFKAVTGTQSLDGWSGHCKKACSTVNARFQDSVDDHVREAQWRHWTGDRDRWEAAADVISWLPAEGGDKA